MSAGEVATVVSLRPKGGEVFEDIIVGKEVL